MGCAADRLHHRSRSAACDLGRDAARRPGASRGARGRQPLDRAAPRRADQRHLDHVRAQARGGCRTGGRAYRPGEGDRVRHRRTSCVPMLRRRVRWSPTWRSATCATTTRAQRIGLAFQSLAALAGPGGQPFTEQTLDQIDDKVAQLESLAEQYQEQVEALNRYYEALGEYVAMLHEVNETLATVTASARAPQADHDQSRRTVAAGDRDQGPGARDPKAPRDLM